MNSNIQKTADEKYCSECGTIIRVKAEICPACGVRQIPIQGNIGDLAPNGKSKIVAAMLAFFLGGIGIHKFYLGSTVMGIIYLVFCWTFVPAIAGFIECILFLIMSQSDFNKKYGQL
jgi:TM2 domain-containing membrane protein YozV